MVTGQRWLNCFSRTQGIQLASVVMVYLVEPTKCEASNQAGSFQTLLPMGLTLGGWVWMGFFPICSQTILNSPI